MSPAKEITFVDGVTVVPAAWLNLIQEALAGLAHNVALSVSGSNVRVVAGADQLAATIYVAGELRVVTSTLSSDMTGKSSGTYNVWAVADSSDDLWALEVGTGSPSGTKTRKIGEADWSGSAITAVRTLVGIVRNHVHADGESGGSIFDSTNPQALSAGSTASPGSVTVAARRDHRHALPAGTAPTSVVSGQSSSVGSSGDVARADHRHGHTAAAGDGFASGTRLFFDQDSPPSGWTRIVTVDDRFLRVVSGARSPNGGTWEQPTHSHTTPSHSHAHDHGSHSHGIPATPAAGGHSHSQGSSGSAGSHNHTGPSHSHGWGTLSLDDHGNHSHSHNHSGSTGGAGSSGAGFTFLTGPGESARHAHSFTTSTDATQASGAGIPGDPFKHVGGSGSTAAQGTGNTSSAGDHSHTNPNTSSATDHQHGASTSNAATPSSDSTGAAPTTNEAATASSWRPAYRDVILAEKD